MKLIDNLVNSYSFYSYNKMEKTMRENKIYPGVKTEYSKKKNIVKFFIRKEKIVNNVDNPEDCYLRVL